MAYPSSDEYPSRPDEDESTHETDLVNDVTVVGSRCEFYH